MNAMTMYKYKTDRPSSMTIKQKCCLFDSFSKAIYSTIISSMDGFLGDMHLFLLLC